MDYKVNELAKLSGVSARTLRYYDSIGLLKPAKLAQNGYPVYGQAEVDLLQQILFYRELGMELCDIGRILYAPDFDRGQALQDHLDALLQKKELLELLIKNVSESIRSAKGEITMTDKEKFEGFKKELIGKNREKYGKEVIERYGEKAFEASNAKVSAMDETEWQSRDDIEKEMFVLLAQAIKKHDPACEEAQRAADLHRRWLCMFWADGMYTKEVHLSLAEGYVCDERFKEYYDKTLGEGGTEFLRDAIAVYAQN